MPIKRLDHVNLRTAKLETMVTWYEDVLGMPAGDRPPFPFPGAWIYAGDEAVVHLVGVDKDLGGIEPKIEHFALTATWLEALIKRLSEHGFDYQAVRVPGYGILQINVHDPDGNHIHIDFSPEEADAAGL